MKTDQKEETRNSNLVQYLTAEGVLRTPRIIAAFEAVDRADFVPEEYADLAYADRPLPIGHGATISQPATVAFMLELLQPEEGDDILDIGAGSGWTTALLRYIAGTGGNVSSVEITPELVEQGEENVQKYYPFHAIHQADEVLGWPEKAPYDRILVSASSEEVPEILVQQLRVGGRMVLPVKESIVRVDRLNETQFRREEFPGFLFVPLR